MAPSLSGANQISDTYTLIRNKLIMKQDVDTYVGFQCVELYIYCIY